MSQQDYKAPYYQLAELLYSLGWRPDCDAQYTNLRDNLHKVTAITHPATTRKLRDDFAGQAMQAMVTKSDGQSKTGGAKGVPLIAQYAYEFADAMLAARAGSKP